MRKRIQPYHPFSKSAKALAKALDVLRIKMPHTRFRPRGKDLVINWGSNVQLFPSRFYLNKPIAVAWARNKLASFKAMRYEGVRIPDFTTSKKEARTWLDDGKAVVCRRYLGASGGMGIVMLRPDDYLESNEIPDCPLYTVYVPKLKEYRVHVFNGEVIDVQQKRLRSGTENPNYGVRNYENGWVFCREDVEAPQGVKVESARAVRSLGLDFGAVDVGFNQHYNSATVYEVNTAPGLEGTTVDKYSDAFSRYFADSA